MRSIEKFYPWIMITIAIMGLYVNYRGYLDATAEDECDCQKTGTNTGTGNPSLRMM